MINNKLKITALSILLTASSLVADISKYEFQTKSLVGIEGGYNNLPYENGTSLSSDQDSAKVGHAGLKVGAETEDFRAFLSARYYMGESRYDYLATYGAELQYKMNATDFMNFYIGANAGIANMKFRGKLSSGAEESFSRTIQDLYLGGDIGTNIHLGENTDLEIGARVMSIQAENTKNSVTYRIGNLVSGYASIIFKWQMD